MTNQQNIVNKSLTEILPSERVYAFADLLKDAQKKMLRLQNADGDFYNYWFGTYKKDIQRRNNWEEKARTWQQEAVSAFERGDTIYFDEHDILQPSAIKNTPILRRKSLKN